MEEAPGGLAVGLVQAAEAPPAEAPPVAAALGQRRAAWADVVDEEATEDVAQATAGSGRKRPKKKRRDREFALVQKKSAEEPAAEELAAGQADTAGVQPVAADEGAEEA